MNHRIIDKSAKYHLVNALRNILRLFSVLLISAEHILQFLELFCGSVDISALNDSVL
jgi:hypothetical protein